MEEYRILPEPFSKYAVSNYSNVMNILTNRILRQADHSQGYKVVCLKNHEYKKVEYVHRLVGQLFLYNDNPHINVIDHINNDKQNNNLYNLRYVSPRQNSYNAKLSRRNKTGYKGITFYNGKYRAQITHNSIKYYLGSYNDLNDARIARQTMSNKLFGEYKNSCEN